MKYNKYFFSFLLLIFIINSSESIGQSTFQLDLGKKFLQLSLAENNDLFVTNLSTENNKLLVSRLTKNGEMKWTKSYADLQYSNIAPTKTNGFLAVCTYKVGKTSPCHLVKCDSSGNVLWSKLIDTANMQYYDTYYSAFVCEANDSNIFLVYLDIHNFYQAVKLDKDGNMLWSKYFPFSTDLWFLLQGIAADENGGLVIAIKKMGCESYCSYSYLQKLDGNGNTEWGGSIYVDNEYGSQPQSIQFLKGHYNIIFSTQQYYGSEYLNCIWSFKPDKTDSKAVVFNNNIFSLKNLAFDQGLNTLQAKIMDNNITNDNWFLNRDSSLYFISYNSPVYYLSKYDSMNRICPDYKAPVFSKKIWPVKIKMNSFYYSDIPRTVSIQDYNIISESDNFAYAKICSGKAIFSNALKTETNEKSKIIVKPAAAEY